MNSFKEFRASNPLHIWRKENGVSMRIAATHLGVSITTIQNWEQGLTKPDSLGFLALAKMMKSESITREWEAWQEQKPLSIS